MPDFLDVCSFNQFYNINMFLRLKSVLSQDVDLVTCQGFLVDGDHSVKWCMAMQTPSLGQSVSALFVHWFSMILWISGHTPFHVWPLPCCLVYGCASFAHCSWWPWILSSGPCVATDPYLHQACNNNQHTLCHDHVSDWTMYNKFLF